MEAVFYLPFPAVKMLECPCWELTNVTPKTSTPEQTSAAEKTAVKLCDIISKCPLPWCPPHWWSGTHCVWHRRNMRQSKRACWQGSSSVWWQGRSGKHGPWCWRLAAPCKRNEQGCQGRGEAEQRGKHIDFLALVLHYALPAALLLFAFSAGIWDTRC